MTPRIHIHFLGLVLMLASATVAQSISNTIEFDDFVMRGRDEQGRESWELHGEHATMQGTIVQIEGLDLQLFTANGSSVTRVLSPHCTFNKTTRTGQSPAHLRVVNDNMTLEGMGYDLLADQQKLKVRSEVTMWIRHVRASVEDEADADANNATDTKKPQPGN